MKAVRQWAVVESLWMMLVMDESMDAAAMLSLVLSMMDGYP